MSLDTMFTFLLLLVVVVVAVAVGGAVYIAVANRRIRRETGRQVGTADIPVGAGPGEEADSPTSREETSGREPRREFYKSMGLETTEDMKLRVYSVEEYREELGGSHTARGSGFVAAIKAYRQLDDEWYAYSPRRAADVLELAPQDYEVDEERLALLVRRLPPGLPESARDVL